jgi:G3E family GTPase
MARCARAKDKFKEDVLIKYKNKGDSPFKHLFRSKGFIWISNYPNNFFEWSHAGIQLFIEGAVPWQGVVSDPNMSLMEQANTGHIGNRKQSLVFIGQNMKEYKQQIIELMDACLVNDREWGQMLKNELTQKFEEDPFQSFMKQYDE